ncbi:hypothetical protein SB761_33465, partial [Pseudomonas sp. SIMBA_064]
LNAKQHEREAAIVAEAGRPKRITIATNMAGRGTDIVLGGNAEKQAAFIEADEAIPADEKARRWIPLGITNMQPSEIMKLAVTI